MTKTEFIEKLKSRLSFLPPDDVNERLTFYGEMIDDRMEEGLSEEEAVDGVGSIDDIVSQTVSDTSLVKLVKEKIKPKRKLKGWETALIIIGSPMWLPLLITFFSVFLALYITVWAVIAAFWAVFAAFAAYGVYGIVYGTLSLFGSPDAGHFAPLGAGLALAGLSVFVFFGCLNATKGILKLTKKLAYKIKSGFAAKEEA